MLCLQETRWKGESVKELGDGYKGFYTGEKSGRSGVGVILDEGLKAGVVEVKRVGSRLIQVKVVWRGVVIHLISAYAPQVNLTLEEKQKFWEEFDGLVGPIDRSEKLVVGGDLNGHVGVGSGEYAGVHGGFGVGRRNGEGEVILDMAVAHDLCVVNTMFKKRVEHLLSYESDVELSQIDYLLYRRDDRGDCKNCKVLPSEGMEGHHRVVILDLKIKGHRKSKETVQREVVKGWKLGEKKEELKEKLLNIIDWDVQGSAGEM